MGCSSSSSSSFTDVQNGLDTNSDSTGASSQIRHQSHPNIIKLFLTDQICRDAYLGPVLESWTRIEIKDIVNTVRFINVAKSETILDGQSWTGMYIVYSGSLSLTFNDSSEMNKVLVAKDSIGGKYLVGGTIEDVTITALEDSEVYYLARKDFSQARRNVLSRLNLPVEDPFIEEDINGADYYGDFARSDAVNLESLSRNNSFSHERVGTVPGAVGAFPTISFEEGSRGGCDIVGNNLISYLDELSQSFILPSDGDYISATNSKSPTDHSSPDNLSILQLSAMQPVASSSSSTFSISWLGGAENSTSVSSLSSPPLPPLPPDYAHLSPRQKQELLWTLISSRPYPANDLPTDVSMITALNLMNPTYLLQTLTHAGDEIHEGRKKVSNAFGASAKVTFHMGASNIFDIARSDELEGKTGYTGLFQTGAPGIIRFSLEQPVLADGDTFRPGIALKLLVDGQGSKEGAPSVNLFATGSPEGQWTYYLRGDSSSSGGSVSGSGTSSASSTVDASSDVNLDLRRCTNHNFFANPLTTAPGAGLAHSSEASLWVLPAISRPTHTGQIPLTHAAAITVSGSAVEPPSAISAPYKLLFLPSAGVKNLFSSTRNGDFRADLARVPIDSLLYHILAFDEGSTSGTTIGSLVLNSPIVASRYGDENLFFRHALV